jgi:hypothetical protein
MARALAGTVTMNGAVNASRPIPRPRLAVCMADACHTR